MTDLTDALDRFVHELPLIQGQKESGVEEYAADAWLIVDTARRVANGRPRKASHLVDTNGNEYWAVTVMVDGPGEYTLIDPPEET